MVTLKTDFSDGDVFYSGATSDTDKLNGITNEINNKGLPSQIYTGTGLDITPEFSTNVETNIELDLLENINNYVNININALTTLYSRHGGATYIKIKMQHKEAGGVYADVFAYQTFNYWWTSCDGAITLVAPCNYQYIYSPTSGEKINGLYLKLYINIEGDENAKAGFTNRQIIITKI